MAKTFCNSQLPQTKWAKERREEEEDWGALHVPLTQMAYAGPL